MKLLLAFLLAVSPTAPNIPHPASVQVNGGRYQCARIYWLNDRAAVDTFSMGKPDDGSLKIVANGAAITPVMAKAYGYGVIVQSKPLVDALMAGQPAVFTYTTMSGKDTITITWPAAPAAGCKEI